ncbi:putative tail completion protein [Erwinia phage pEa_SNUABM_5]|uniref:Putative tail completion protein n=1 Tax=Erwinia phage pEa_SNUABM_5 TaxID=2797313 RepID=A0A7T8IVP4_9CAUD|nr:putative tail completion protein [Erwinia phage pEa_SNUABM_5]QQO90286.1 putative tail completion protein [Erwinia phage pEa_SNUABM_5]
MSIKDIIKNSTSLKATIFGIQRQFRNGFGLQRFVWTVHNNPKQGIRALNAQSTDYPYGWIKFNSMALNRELMQNPKTAGRYGTGWALNEDPDNAIVVQNYYFPMIINAEATVKFMSIDDALAFCQQFMVAAIVELLAFEVQMPTTKFTVRVLLEGDSVPLPYIEDLDDGSTPGSFEIILPLTIQTKIGFSTDQAKINNYGEVTIDTKLDIDDYDPSVKDLPPVPTGDGFDDVEEDDDNVHP